MSKRVIILGGDGFCGWPTSLFLSRQGYDVVIVDNLSRRMIDIELGCDSLTPIASIFKRIDCWKELTGQHIPFYNFDISRNYHRLLMLIKEFEPDAVVHFAEQRAARVHLMIFTAGVFSHPDSLSNIGGGNLDFAGLK